MAEEKEKLDGRIIQDEFGVLVDSFGGITLLHEMLLGSDYGAHPYACIDIMRCSLKEIADDMERVLNRLFERFSGLERYPFYKREGDNHEQA